MSRAYLRLDPLLQDHKGSYPDGALATFVLVLCLAEQQPKRGYFRNERILRALLDRRGRWIRFLVEHEDLVVQTDGSLYVDGWLEWQEGDVTVPERMRRLRARKRNGVTLPDTPPDTAGGVYPPSSGGGGGGNSGGGAPSRAPTMKPKPGLHDGSHPDCAVCAPLRAPAASQHPVPIVDNAEGGQR